MRAAARALPCAAAATSLAAARGPATRRALAGSATGLTHASASFLATNEAGTASLAAVLAARAVAGDALCLFGDVGAGKSSFRCDIWRGRVVVSVGRAVDTPLPLSLFRSRAFVRAAAGDPDLAVPSPTYLLHNVYDDVDGEGRGRGGAWA